MSINDVVVKEGEREKGESQEREGSSMVRRCERGRKGEERKSGWWYE